MHKTTYCTYLHAILRLTSLLLVLWDFVLIKRYVQNQKQIYIFFKFLAILLQHITTLPLNTGARLKQLQNSLKHLLLELVLQCSFEKCTQPSRV